MIEMLDVLRVGGQSDVFITEYPLYQLDCDLHELDGFVIDLCDDLGHFINQEGLNNDC
jgi:hypothetical protein